MSMMLRLPLFVPLFLAFSGPLFAQGGAYTGRIQMEFWKDVPGTDVESLRSAPEFPGRPSGRSYLSELSTLSGWAADCGVRIRGYLHPPASGEYVFRAECPGTCELYLGKDGSPAGKRQIIAPGQHESSPVTLSEGGKYFVEVLQKAGGGESGLTIGWRLPDGSWEQPIPGERISSVEGPNDVPEAERIFDNMAREHPRLLLSSYDAARVRRQIESDPHMRERYELLRREAEDILNRRPVSLFVRQENGLEGAGRQLINRFEVLGLVYLIERENGTALAKRCVQRAHDRLAAMAEMPGWFPDKFVSAAHMAQAMAVGYDMFYATLPEKLRQAVVKALVRNALDAYLSELETPEYWWHGWKRFACNWNLAINGGIGLAAMAVGDETSPKTAEVLRRALENTRDYGIRFYATDGGSPVGPGYWRYAAFYFVPWLSALESGLGSDFGLADAPGFFQTGSYPIYMTSPIGRTFNYSDSGDRPGGTPAFFWFSRRFNQPHLAWYQRELFKPRADARELLWFDRRGEEQDWLRMPRDMGYRGTNVFTVRSDWQDKDGLFVGVAAIENFDFLHAQLDQGTFVIDALGERWALDLGSNPYGLPGNWERDPGGRRWTYYPVRAEGHNVLVVNPGSAPTNQRIHARAKVLSADMNSATPQTVLDLTDAYSPSGARLVQRTILVPQRRFVVVEDNVQLESPSELLWLMHTDAQVEVSRDRRSATLSKNGKTLEATIQHGPPEAAFTVTPATPLPSSPKPPRPHGIDLSAIQRLTVRLENVTDLKLSVTLTPQS